MELLPAKRKKKFYVFPQTKSMPHIYIKAPNKENLEHPFLKLSSVIIIKVK